MCVSTVNFPTKYTSIISLSVLRGCVAMLKIHLYDHVAKRQLNILSLVLNVCIGSYYENVDLE